MVVREGKAQDQQVPLFEIRPLISMQSEKDVVWTCQEIKETIMVSVEALHLKRAASMPAGSTSCRAEHSSMHSTSLGSSVI